MAQQEEDEAMAMTAPAAGPASPARPDNLLQLPGVEVRPWTMLDNPYLDEAMAALSGAAWKCLCFIIRQTVGFHAPEVRLSLSAFCDGIRKADGSILSHGTGLSKPAVIAAIVELQQAHIIYKSQEEVRTAVPAYGLEPLTSWRLADLACKKTLQADPASQKTLQVTSPACQKILQAQAPASKKSLHIKEIGEERNTRGKKTDTSPSPDGDASPDSGSSSSPAAAQAQKPAKTQKQFASDSLEMLLAHHIRDRIRSWLPDGNLPETPGDARWQAWARGVDEMLRLDHRTPAQVRALIDALAREKYMSFWREHVQSPAALRKKWDKLATRYQEHGGKLPNGGAAAQASAPAGQPVTTASSISERNMAKLLAATQPAAAQQPEGGR